MPAGPSPAGACQSSTMPTAAQHEQRTAQEQCLAQHQAGIGSSTTAVP